MIGQGERIVDVNAARSILQQLPGVTFEDGVAWFPGGRNVYLQDWASITRLIKETYGFDVDPSAFTTAPQPIEIDIPSPGGFGLPTSDFVQSTGTPGVISSGGGFLGLDSDTSNLLIWGAVAVGAIFLIRAMKK